jgi:hypothetical protein
MGHHTICSKLHAIPIGSDCEHNLPLAEHGSMIASTVAGNVRAIAS